MAKARSPDSRPWLPPATGSSSTFADLDPRRPIAPSPHALNTARSYLSLHQHHQQQVHAQHQRHQLQLQQQNESAQQPHLQNLPMLIKLVNAKDILPYVLLYLDMRSLLALTSVNNKIRREILMPPVPALNALTPFLEHCTVTCHIAMFESLKDFISKYRSFRPAHLHFTYSAEFNLSSIIPAEPVTTTTTTTTTSNCKNSLSPIHPSSSSPLSSTYGHTAISTYGYAPIDMASNHHISSETAHENDHPNPQQLMPESSRTASSESVRSCSSFCNDLQSTKSMSAAGLSSYSPSDVSEISNSSSSMDIGKNVDLALCVASSSTAAEASLLNFGIPSSTSSQQRGDYQQRCTKMSTVSNGTGSHPIHVDIPNLLTPETIPVHTTSTTPRFKGHGFELSYWQKFALNELFLRSLPFLKTLTIGRTDKPKEYPLDEDTERTSIELATGVCYFLARCFNVMHDMPDTALESVIWMDVTKREVVLLAAMIELRDIVVDDRYWRRGYWSWITPPSNASAPHEDHLLHQQQSHQQRQDDEQRDEGGGGGGETRQWEGFYYLLYQEEKDDKPLARRLLPPTLSASLSTSGSTSTLNSNGSGERRLSSPPITPIVGSGENNARIDQALNVDRGSVPNPSLVRTGSSPDTRALPRLSSTTESLDLISMSVGSSSLSSQEGAAWGATNNSSGSSSMQDLSHSTGGGGDPTLAGLPRHPTYHSQNGTITTAAQEAELDLAVLVYKELRRRVAENATFFSPRCSPAKWISVTNGGTHATTLRRNGHAVVDRKGKAPVLNDNFNRLDSQY